LVVDVRSGSEAAFEVIYDRHHRGILGFCRHMLGSAEEAEDAVQHTFMAAYRSLTSSDKPIQLKAWLYTIARNRCLSVLRARREQPSDDLDSLSTDGFDAQVQQRQDLRDLLRDVAGLPEDQRAALVLAEVGDLPMTTSRRCSAARRRR
jgi:RNA polymerase sigma factor (sigma-70 family)